MVDGAFNEYIDQCNGAMWLLGRKWMDSVGGLRRMDFEGGLSLKPCIP